MPVKSSITFQIELSRKNVNERDEDIHSHAKASFEFQKYVTKVSSVLCARDEDLDS